MARRRTAAILLGLVALIVVLIVVVPGGGGRSSAGSPRHHATLAASSASSGATTRNTKGAAKGIPAIEAGVLPYSLSAAVSREVVLPAVGNDLTVAGGLTAGQTSTDAVYTLDTISGQEIALPSMAVAVHDASGAFVGGRAFTFGGGSPDTVATIQHVSAPLPAVASTHVQSSAKHSSAASPPSVTGQLPQPRSDSQAVTIGSTTYVVGGYDGTNPDPEVLATTDGHHFSVVVRLPVSVRYPAVAALGKTIYAFGGEAIGGRNSGVATNVIQKIDTSNSSVAIVGHLPAPLAGASAAVLGGNIYVAGGVSDTSSSGSGVPAIGNVWAFDPVHHKLLGAGTLPVPTSYAAVTVLGGRAWIVGGENNGTPLTSVEMMVPNRGFGTAGLTGAGSPYFGGRLLIADRGNDRLVLLNTQNQVVWNYPSAKAPPPAGSFYFPDDAFFAKHGTEIISNQEQNETLVILGFPSGKVLWTYGHPHQPGQQPGYLYEPDDAYLLKNGQITVADADNCRILFINPNGSVASQVGQSLNCVHQPGVSLGSPNGDTPLADGNVLVSEITGSWISEYTPQGKLVWTVHVPIGYPSDPQQLGPDLYLVANYSQPGGFIEFTRQGQVVYRYQPPSGQGEMDQPSLAELLPSGVIMANDDYRDRMVAIDPDTQALVWQYGVSDHPGTAPGMLNIPDGFDLLMNNGAQPLHPLTG